MHFKSLHFHFISFHFIFIACRVSFRSVHVVQNTPKRSFYRAPNTVFAKVGRFASEEVILELILKKMFTNPYLWIGGVCIA